MFHKMNYFINLKVPAYTVILIALSALFISISICKYYKAIYKSVKVKRESLEWVETKDIEGQVTEKGVLKRGKKDGYWETYMYGNIESEGYYRQGRKIGTWYYYTQNGYLSFIDDMNKGKEKYTAARYQDGRPGGVSYILRDNTENIVAQELYDRHGDLLCLIIEIPSKNLEIRVEYGENRYIKYVEYLPHKSEDSAVLPKK